jgi:hypothetical protein
MSMQMGIGWPTSRTARNGNCPECRLARGRLEVRDPLTIDGIDFWRLTCSYCGYTQLFDSSVIRSTPYGGPEEEILPDDTWPTSS